MVKCRPLHQVVPKREEEERKRLGRWRKTGEEAATGDALHRTRCPHQAPRPRRGLRVVVNLQKHGRFGRAFWGRTGMSGRGVAVWLRGVSPHQLCLLWRLSAAVGSFAHTHSPFPPRSHCSPDIASYAKKPSASFIPPPPEAGGRSQNAVLPIMRTFQLDAKTGQDNNGNKKAEL